MLDCVFLVPIADGITGNLIPRYLELQSWCDKNNSKILTCHRLFLNFARNYLATGGRGFADPRPPDAKWLFWIDSDIDFTIEQVEDLLSIPEEHRFCSGWYRSNFGDHAMCGDWDIDFFQKDHHMPFLSVKALTKKAKENPNELIEAYFTGFGFTRIHRSIIEEMTYPYFTLNMNKLGEYQDMSFDDVSFCQNCKKETGVNPLIVPRLRVGHYKSFFV